MANEKDPKKSNPASANSRPLTGNARTRARAAERRASREETETTSTGEMARVGSGVGRTAERRAEREQARRRRQFLTIGLIVGVIALVVIAAVIALTLPAEAPIPAESIARYEGLLQSVTDEGYPRLGDTDAPVKVVEFSSFDCPNCRQFHADSIDRLVALARAGSISLTYAPIFGTGSITNGQGAARSAVCAAEQQLFWPLHDAFFNWQGIYGNQSFTDNRIRAGLDAVGVDGGVFAGCRGSGRVETTLENARRQSTELTNYAGTPTISINGVVPVDENDVPLAGAAAILEAIDAEIARLAGAAPSAESTAEATPEATGDATSEAVVTLEATLEAVIEITPTDEATAEAVTPIDEPTPDVTAEATPDN